MVMTGRIIEEKGHELFDLGFKCVRICRFRSFVFVHSRVFVGICCVCVWVRDLNVRLFVDKSSSSQGSGVREQRQSTRWSPSEERG